LAQASFSPTVMQQQSRQQVSASEQLHGHDSQGKRWLRSLSIHGTIGSPNAVAIMIGRRLSAVQPRQVVRGRRNDRWRKFMTFSAVSGPNGGCGGE
jgi:hypothetical protein